MRLPATKQLVGVSFGKHLDSDSSDKAMFQLSPNLQTREIGSGGTILTMLLLMKTPLLDSEGLIQRKLRASRHLTRFSKSLELPISHLSYGKKVSH